MFRVIRRRAANVLPIASASVWIVAAACDGDSPASVAPEDPDTVVSSIRVKPSEGAIGVLGTQFEVGALALNEDGEMLYGSTSDPDRFSWSSSAPGVATVNDTTCHPPGRSCRRVTGVSEGTATITATSEGVTGSMTATVRDAARLAWSLPIATGPTNAGITIGADGTIYVASKTRLFALSPQGGVLWTLDTPDVFATPAIGDDGTLYFGSWSTALTGSLTAVGPNGAIRWVVSNVGGIQSSPALGPDGTIYVGSGDHHLYAVNQQGEIQWSYESTEPFARSSPAVASDGTIYIGGIDEHLRAINPDGSARWIFATGDKIQSSPSIGVDGTIYVGSLDTRLYAVNPDGTERWRSLPLTKNILSSPSIGPDGTIYVGAGGLFAFDPGGSVRWSYMDPVIVAPTPILAADGTVYASIAYNIHAVDAQGRYLWHYPTGGSSGSAAIGIDGTVLLASRDSTVYAIVENASANGGHAGAPWPQGRANRANTGRAGG